MKNTVRNFATLSAAIIILAAACKKDDTTSNNNNNNTATGNKALLIGNWNVTHSADDSNKDNVLDESEKSPMEAGSSFVIAFKADGNGSQHMKVGSLLDTTVNFTWSLMNSDKDIVMATSTDKDTIHIVTLTSTDMVVKDNNDKSADMASWTILKKQ